MKAAAVSAVAVSAAAVSAVGRKKNFRFKAPNLSFRNTPRSNILEDY